MDVELAGRHTYGRTVIDFADRTKLGFNCDVVVAFDVARPDARSLTRSAL